MYKNNSQNFTIPVLLSSVENTVIIHDDSGDSRVYDITRGYVRNLKIILHLATVSDENYYSRIVLNRFLFVGYSWNAKLQRSSHLIWNVFLIPRHNQFSVSFSNKFRNIK